MTRKRMTSTDARFMRSLQLGYRDELRKRRKAGEPARCRHPRRYVIRTSDGALAQVWLEKCTRCGALRRGRLKMCWRRWRKPTLKVTNE